MNDIEESNVFTEEELEAIETYLEEQAAIADGLRAGVPIWQMVPVERLRDVLTDEQLAEAEKDEDRMSLADAEADEVQMPLLKELRLSGGDWIEAEMADRLSAEDPIED